ncbi:MAG: Ig-like domain-containing protein, partial [Cardiobacteriaceae bacterium]|nr:Ig-like domain-containing protein [Cardiobacteriaceae bacterium]
YTATFTAGANPGNASVRVDTSAFQDEAGNANDTASNLALTITQTSNTPPKAVNDNATTKVGEAVTVDVLKNDSDADGDTLTITSATLANPAQGRADIVGNQIRFTPAAGVNGDVAIAYTVTDGKGGSANATLTVTVDDKLPPPTFTKGEGTDHGSVTITPHETALSMEGRYQQTPTLSSPFKIFRNSVDEPWQFDAGTDKKLLVLNPETGAVTLVAGVVMGGGKVTASNSRGAETSTDNATADIAPDGKYLVSIIGDNSVTEGLGAKYYVILNKPATEEVRINAKVRYVGSADASDFEVEGAAFKFAAGERIKDVSLNTSLRFDRSIKKVTDPYEGDENYKMELTFEGLSSLAGSASTTSNWTANKKHEFVETVIIDRLPYYEPLVQVVNQGEVSISAQAGAEKLSIRYENEQGQQQAIVLANVDKARNLWEAENPLPTDVVLHDSYVVLSAKAVKDGSVVTAFHSSSDGAKTGESITATAGNNPSPKIISGTTGADGDDILIAPDVDPADYATLLAPPRYEAYQELDARAELLLGQSANDVPLMLDGKAGNDILISLNSADTLRGGDGLDTFVFITDEKASLTADKILDFHAGMDKIFLLGGQREITNARFDEGTQTLHYQSGQGADMYHHSIVIQADHGNPLLAYDVEKAVIIL